jgi:DedD protein
MEKKKIVLVAVSIGVFLVILIGASILVFSPKSPSPVASSAPASSIRPVERLLPAGETKDLDAILPPADAVDLVKGPGSSQDPTPSSSSNRPKDNVFYIYGENPGQTTTAAERPASKNNQVVIDVPSTTPVVRTQPNTPSSVTPAPAAKPAARPAAPSQTPAPAARQPAASKPAASGQKLIDNYWVQTGSFSAKVRAETVKETLASKGISSLIENREVNGTNFFRVRVGPYTSRNEADYWLALIKAMDGFEESQIWKTQTPSNL